jgi:DNA repair protein RecO (recombination protein O)
MRSPIAVEAIVLTALRYGESSKIVRLATRGLGVQSAIAKGALRPKSRFGAALQPLSIGQGLLVLSVRSDLHILTGFDLHHLPSRLGESLERYAAAAALAEVMLRFAPAAPHEESYEVFKASLLELELMEPESAETVGLRRLWEVVSVLGFTPSLEICVRDGSPIPPDGALSFTAREGGALCPSCARGQLVTLLGEFDRRDLTQLLAPDAPLPVLTVPQAAAHRRLLARYLRHQLGGDAKLPALEFWQSRVWEKAT